MPTTAACKKQAQRARRKADPRPRAPSTLAEMSLTDEDCLSLAGESMLLCDNRDSEIRIIREHRLTSNLLNNRSKIGWTLDRENQSSIYRPPCSRNTRSTVYSIYRPLDLPSDPQIKVVNNFICRFYEAVNGGGGGGGGGFRPFNLKKKHFELGVGGEGQDSIFFGGLNQKSAMIIMCKIHIYIDPDSFRQIH